MARKIYINYIKTFALLALMLCVACGTDNADEPGYTDNPDQGQDQDTEYPDPAQGDNQDDPPTGETEYTDPEPLTAELREVLTENKTWVRRSVFRPDYERYSSTWTEICTYNGVIEGYETWNILHSDDKYNYDTPYWCYREEEGRIYQ